MNQYYLVTDILHMTRIIPRKVFKTINYMKHTRYPLKKHQIAGLKWFLKREIETPLKGGLLCDDAGMGKTIQMAALMYANVVDTTLIVVPVAVIHQWRDVMGCIFGSSNIYTHYSPNRIKHWDDLKAARLGNTSKLIVLTTYGIVVNSSPKNDNLLFEHCWDRVILDEGQIIRNSKTRLFKKAVLLKRTHSWILSGTPIQNSARDIKNLFKFITNHHLSESVPKLISRYLLRRTKDVMTGTTSELLNYSLINYKVPFRSRTEQEMYNMIHRDTLNEYNNATPSDAYGIELLEKLLRLRQATLHINISLRVFRHKFNLTNVSYITHQSSKLSKMGEVIDGVTGLSLIFCQYHSEMTEVGLELQNRGITYESYDGTMNHIQRRNVLNKFVDHSVSGPSGPSGPSTPSVLIIQIKAGGVGLNLQQFSNVFILSPDWNPSNEIQAIARAHRIGQTKKVNVYKFTVVSNPEYETNDFIGIPIRIPTIDEYILTIQKKKRTIMADLLKDASLSYTEISIDPAMFEHGV